MRKRFTQRPLQYPYVSCPHRLGRSSAKGILENSAAIGVDLFNTLRGFGFNTQAIGFLPSIEKNRFFVFGFTEMAFLCCQVERNEEALRIFEQSKPQGPPNAILLIVTFILRDGGQRCYQRHNVCGLFFVIFRWWCPRLEKR